MLVGKRTSDHNIAAATVLLSRVCFLFDLSQQMEIEGPHRSRTGMRALVLVALFALLRSKVMSCSIGLRLYIGGKNWRF